MYGQNTLAYLGKSIIAKYKSFYNNDAKGLYYKTFYSSNIHLPLPP